MRLKALIAVHLVIGVCPAATHSLSVYFRFRPFLCASVIHPVIQSVTFAQLMLLSFWVAMGTSREGRRLVGMLLATLYIAMWLMVGNRLDRVPANMILDMFGLELKMVVVFTGVFLGIRRWKADLRCFPDPAAFPRPTGLQFSLLHLLVIVSVVAIILALVRSIRTATGEEIGWYPVLESLFWMFAYLINLLGAVWAVLSVGRPGLRILLVILIAAILAASGYFATWRGRLIDWWLLSALTVTHVAATAIVVVSLLVVRSCGYRLVPKT